MSEITQTPPVFRPQPAKRQKGERDRDAHHDHPADGEGGAGGDGTPRDLDVVISLMGIRAEDATPGVRKALGEIMVEFDRQRVELERQQLRAAYLEQQQDRDPVLPVGGRLALLRRLSRAAHRSEQSEMTNALVILHVEGAEAVRRSQGKPVAERLMGDVARRIQSHLRETDFLASLGGYDFGVLLPLAGSADGEEKARAIAADAAAHGYGGDGQPVVLSVVWGLVVFGADADPEELIAAADADLLTRQAN